MGSPPKFVIHINFLPDMLMFEPRRIWTALGRAEDNGRIPRGTRAQIEQRLGQTAIYLASRDYIMRTAIHEQKTVLEAFGNLIPDQWMMADRYRVVNTPAAFQARDRVLLGVDSFLFEFRAYLELLAAFVFRVLSKTGQPPPSKHTLPSGEVLEIRKKGKLQTHDFLRYLCGRSSLPEDWYRFLAEHRNFFTHKAAPYIAVEDRGIRPPEYDFLIMRVNIHDFDTADPSDYFRLSDCTSVVKGVAQLAGKAQELLVNILET